MPEILLACNCNDKICISPDGSVLNQWKKVTRTSFINSSHCNTVMKKASRGLGFWRPCTCAVAVLLFTCVGSVSCTMLVAATRCCCSEEELCTEVTTTEVLVSPGECAKGSPPGLPAVPFSSTIPSIALVCDPLQKQQYTFTPV